MLVQNAIYLNWVAWNFSTFGNAVLTPMDGLARFNTSMRKTCHAHFNQPRYGNDWMYSLSV